MSETVQLGVLSGRRKRRTKQLDIPIAQRLPNEILLHIFNHVPRIRAKPSSYITGQVDPMRHIPRVCKAWFQPATEVLYKFVCVPRVAAAMLLHRTLAGESSSTSHSPNSNFDFNSNDQQHISHTHHNTYPHSHRASLLAYLTDKKKKKKKNDRDDPKPKSALGSLVKVLLLPKRVWVGCPERLLALFTRIIDLCDSLEEVQVICNITRDRRFPHTLPRYPLPIPVHRHLNLKSLALSNAEARLYTNFPLYTDQFPDLEELCLSGFRISPLVCSNEIKPLMKLRSVRLESCDIGGMEDWLMRCPKLARLEIDLSIWTIGPDGGILSQNSLKRLQWSRTSTPIQLEHIKGCHRLEHLTIDYATFAGQWKSIPNGVEDLTVIVKETDEVSKHVLSEFMEASEQRLLKLRNFSMRIPKSHGWIATGSGSGADTGTGTGTRNDIGSGNRSGTSAGIATGNANANASGKASTATTMNTNTTAPVASGTVVGANQSWLEDLVKKKGVKLHVDLTKFGPLPVKTGSTLWQDSAQKIRRFTKPTRASELDWEQQYRKKEIIKRV